MGAGCCQWLCLKKKQVVSVEESTVALNKSIHSKPNSSRALPSNSDRQVLGNPITLNLNQPNPKIPPLNLKGLKATGSDPSLFSSKLSPIEAVILNPDKETDDIVAEFSVSSESSLMPLNSQLDRGVIFTSEHPSKSVSERSHEQTENFIQIGDASEKSS